MSSWPLQKLAGGRRVASPVRPGQPAGEPTREEDEVVLCRAHRPGGAGCLLRLHPPAQLRVRSLEADAAGRDFPGRTASGETQPRADSLSHLESCI